MEHLINKFNHLGGSSRSEHYERFSRYMKELDALEVDDRLQVLNQLKAVHRLEEIFLTKLLLRYTQTETLKSVVCGGDRILNRIIGIHKPFPFQSLDTETFKNELFPNISYITRTRYINNLSLTIDRDDTGEEFFKWILSDYGIRAAVPLLTVCSKDFILEMIQSYRIIFGERQLVRLHQRFGHDFIVIYYEELAKYEMKTFNTQVHFAKYLSRTDITTFFHLLQYGQPKIGKTGFINFLRNYHTELITEPHKFKQLIKRKLLYRFLNREQYTQYFTNILPTKLADFCMWDILRDLELLPMKDRGTFMAHCFRARYGFEIYTFQSTSLTNYFHLITLEERMKFNELKLDEKDMLEFYECEKSFPLLRQQLNLTSDINTRCELVLKMFKCAKNNDNETALVEASQYVCERHRADNSSIRSDVFLYIKDVYKLETLSAEFWKYWEQIIYTEAAIVEYPIWIRDMLEALLHYKFLQGRDLLTDVKKWMKEVGSYNVILPSKCKKLQKYVLLQMPQLLPEVFPNDAKQYSSAFLNALWQWNKNNPNEFVSYYAYPEMIQLAVEHFDGTYYNDVIGRYVMMYRPNDAEELKIRQKLFESFEKFAQHDAIWKRLIRNELDLVDKYWEYLFNKQDRGYYEMEVFYELSMLHFTSLPSKIREKSLGILRDAKSEEHSVKIALCALSYERDFLEIINLYEERFYPSSEGGIDVFEVNIHDTLDMRGHVCWCLTHVTQAHKLIECTLKFCVKDYFARAIPLLTYTLFNSPQSMLKDPLNILQTRPLTITKRAIYYCTCLYNNVETCAALRLAGSREHSKSLQKFIFNRSFKAFCNICNTETWNILLEHFKFIFEKDTETINMVFDFHLIPRRYVGEFVAKVWQTIGKLFVDHYHFRLLSVISVHIMPLLSNELCDDIIQFNLLHAKEQFRSTDVDFIYRYLISSADQMQHRFQLLAVNTTKHLLESVNDEFMVGNKKRQNVWFIINEVCTRTLSDKETALEIRQRFMSIFFEGIPQLPKLYSELEFVIKAQIISYALSNEGLIVPALLAFLSKVEEFGDVGVEYYANIVKELLRLMNDDVGYTLNAIQSLLELSRRSALANKVHILAAKLLPARWPANEQQAVLFRALVMELQQQSPNICIIVAETLKNLSYS